MPFSFDTSFLVYLLDGAIRGATVTLFILLLLKLLPGNINPNVKRLVWLLVLVLFIVTPVKNVIPGFAIEFSPPLAEGHQTHVRFTTPFGNEYDMQLGGFQALPGEDQSFQEALSLSWQQTWQWCREYLRLPFEGHFSLFLLSIWLLGVVVYLLLFTYSYYRFYAKVQALPQIQHARIKQLFTTCSHLIRSQHRYNRSLASRLDSIVLLDSSSLCSPAVYGLRQPKILLPLDNLLALNDKQISFILMHEMIHILQRDSQWNYLNHLLLGIQWFNPFCYIANKHFRTTLELSCDRKVLTYMGHDQNIEYGRAILQMLEFEQFSSPAPGIGLGKNMAELKQRFQLLTSQPPNTTISILTAVTVIFILLTVAGSISAGITPNPDSVTSPEPATCSCPACSGSSGHPEPVSAPLPYTIIKQQLPDFFYKHSCRTFIKDYIVYSCKQRRE